ncbi:MAG: hypothetical protein KA273_02975 [Bacteroidales bacterium]|nr:hypothetical protein [Bacteroidales bacterium]
MEGWVRVLFVYYGDLELGNGVLFVYYGDLVFGFWVWVLGEFVGLGLGLVEDLLIKKRIGE